MWNTIIIWFFALFTVVCALSVVTQKNPIVCALFLIGNFFGLAGLYLSLQAPFIAAIQILVYAGAITVLFIFVIMLLNLKTDAARFSKFRLFSIPRVATLLFLLWIIFSFIYATAFPIATPDLKEAFTVKDVATLLFSKYLFPFELASYLLLIALVGGVVLAKKKVL